MLRVETIFTGVEGSPYYNRLHFLGDDLTDPQALIDATYAFWNAVTASSTNALDFQVQGDVYEIDISSGQPTGVLSGAPVSGNGDQSAGRFSPALQVLIRMRTGVFVNGRQITGRVFVPALTEDAGDDAVSGILITEINAACTALINASATADALWCVYSPTNTTAAAVSSFSVWNQFAVQRSRRD